MKTTIDPVCGMKADPATAPQAEHQGKTYYFCSSKCQQRFQEHPNAFPWSARRPAVIRAAAAA